MNKTVDWSCKHDILIKNPDGTYSHMDEPYFQAEKVTENVWRILSSGDYSYCVKGNNRAVAIDTGYGAGNIRAYLEKLTEMPVPHVINTHSHFDHTANNGYFERAYMHKLAIPNATVPFASFIGVDFITDYEKAGIDDGFIYMLEDKKLEIFFIPDHTKDGIAILDRADRTLFVGDEFMGFGKVLTHVDVKTFYGYLERLLKYKSEIEHVCAGGGVYDIHFLEKFEACAKAILEGDIGKRVVENPPRPGKLPPGPNGEVVYDRMMPHFGDGGVGKEGKDIHDIYVKENGGIRLYYDRKREKNN